MFGFRFREPGCLAETIRALVVILAKRFASMLLFGREGSCADRCFCREIRAPSSFVVFV